ncbi:MAG: glycoside hydrolase domain-containing protein [Promethearchaeota archaeon]
MFMDGFPLAKNLDHLPGTPKISTVIEYFLVILLLSSTLVVFLKDKIRFIAGLASLASWLVFCISWVSFNASGTVDRTNAPELRMGVFMIQNFWVVIIVGMTSIIYLIATIKRTMEEVARQKQSATLQVALAALASIGIAASHQWLFTFDLELIIVFTCLPALVWHAWETRDAKPITGRKNGFFGTVFFASFFFIMYLSIWMGTATLFYFAVEFGVAILSSGMLVAIALVEVCNRLAKQKLPYYVMLLIAAALLSLEFFLLSNDNVASDSTYDTNPAYLWVVFVAGIVTGSLVQSMNLAYMQYKVQPREKRRFAHEMGRWLLASIIAGSFFYGTLNGLEEKTWTSKVSEYTQYGIYVMFIIAAILGTFILAGLLLKKMSISYPRREPVVRQGIHVAKKKKVNRAILMACVVAGSSCMALIPHVMVIPEDGAGYPNYLGNLGTGVVVTEVSPLSKVGRFNLIQRQAATGGASTAIISRSMARNEFETIQVVISNWGMSPVKLNGITITNSTHGGYNTTFSLPPVNNSWKNESWEWPRFTARYVDEIQPGCPNVLYDLNGNQTRVQLVSGRNETRPEPVARAGSNLAVWFTLYAANDTVAGNYSDEISIQTTKGDLNITLVTRIWNFTLPTNHSLRVALGNRKVYRIPNRDDWTKSFLNHRMSPYFPYVPGSFYTVNHAYNNVTFNFTQFEVDLANAISHGQDHFRITFKPSDVYGPDAFTTAFNDTAISYYSQLGNFLGNHSLPGGGTWLDLAIVYAIDEPDEDQYAGFNRWSDLVHSAHPGWKILLTEQVEPAIVNHVDIWCPHINGVNTANIATRHAAGDDFWYYTCCNLVNKPTVSFIDPAVDHLALFWCAWAFDFDGFLFWDAQAYINTTSAPGSFLDPFRVGYDGIGDAIMLLSDANLQPVTTIVWETMRDGLEHLEYMEMLNSLNGSSTELATIKASWADFIRYPRDATLYIQLRNAIGEAIDSLS